MSVLLFHANDRLFPLGFAGVDVFFVVSGFVVTPLILRIFETQDSFNVIKKDLLEFYRRRFFRLAPALAFVLIISAMLIFLLGPPGDHQRIARQGIATILILGNVGAYIYGGDYFSPNPIPFIHTWSLSVEEQMYLFLPLLVMAVYFTRKNLRTYLFRLMIILTLLSFLSFLSPQLLHPIYSLFGIELVNQFSFYSPFDRLWEFLIGSLGYLLQNKSNTLVLKFRKVSISALLLTLFSLIPLGPKPLSVIASILTIYIILSRSLDSLPTKVRTKLEWLGDRSYSIYLIHLPLLYLAQYSAVTGEKIHMNRNVQTASALIASVFLGSIIYSRIENRFRLASRGFLVDTKVRPQHILLFLITPLMLLVSMSVGSERNYWGLDKNVSIELRGASTPEKNCARDSLVSPSCEIVSANSKGTVLMIGDSHAGHYADALITAARISNWNLTIWWHGGCPFEIIEISDSRTSFDCLQKNLRTVEWAMRNKPNAIIVSQYIHKDSSQTALSQSLHRLRKITPNVLLIENNPIFPDKDYYMVSRPIILNAYVPPKKFKMSQMDRTGKSASDKLANWSRENGIGTLNVESLFCDSNYCNRFSKEGWLYRDVDHLTILGAKRVVPQLQKYLSGL